MNYIKTKTYSFEEFREDKRRLERNLAREINEFIERHPGAKIKNLEVDLVEHPMPDAESLDIKYHYQTEIRIEL